MAESSFKEIIRLIPYVILVCLAPYIAMIVSWKMCDWMGVDIGMTAAITTIVGLVSASGLIVMCLRNLQKIWKNR